MISLELTFVDGSDGYSTDPGPLTYRQIKRSAKVALYQRFYKDGRPKDFEVFFIKVDPKGKVLTFPGGVTKVMEDDKEKYPSKSQFGRIAWSFHNLGAAEARFDRLEKESIAEDADDETPSVKLLEIPLGEFSTTELAEKNKVLYVTAANFIKAGVADGTLKFSREERRQAKGKATKLYTKA